MKKQNLWKRILGFVLTICLVCTGCFVNFGAATAKAEGATTVVSHEVPSNVSRYQVSYTGQQCTTLYNATPINWTDSTTVYLTYRVVSYTAGTHLQGYCGTNKVDSWPYDFGTGVVTRTNTLLSTGQEAKSEILKVGYTYFVAFDVTNSGMTVRAERVKDGVTETVLYDRIFGTNEGTEPVDYSTLNNFGLYLGESADTATLSDVSIYDANGNDLGVKGYNLADGAIQKLRKPLSHEIPRNVSKYNVAYTGWTGTLYLCNQTALNWTTDTTVYMTYTVDSYGGTDGNQGFIGTTESNYTAAYPYGNGVGTFDRGNVVSTGKNYLLAPGYTYYVEYDLTNSGANVRIERVKDGVTESVQLPTANGFTMTTWTDITYFGLYLMEATTATLSNVSIYDDEGRDLGVQCPDLVTYPQAGTISKVRNPINQEIPENVVGYNVSYKGEELSMLCNRQPVEWLTHTTLYLTYTVDAFSGQSENHGLVGSSNYKANWPYGGDPDLGAMYYNKPAETGNMLMLEGYTYFVAFDITDKGMDCRVERVKDGVTETVILPKKNTLETGAWTSLVNFGLYMDASTVAELSNVSIYDESGNDLGLQSSKDVTIYLSHVDTMIENNVLTLKGSGSVSASMVNEALAEQQVEKDTITEIHVEEKISIISANAFQGFTALEKVSYASSVKNVSEHAFVNCASGVVISCAPGTCFVGGLENATVVHSLDIEAVGEQTSFKGDILTLHLVPTGAVSGILNETRYSGLSVQIDEGELKPITLVKTDAGTLSFVLRNLDKKDFVLTIPGGVAKTADSFNGVSGFELLENTTIYVTEGVITMKPMAGVNVTATVETEGKTKTDASTGVVTGVGFYFNTLASEDSLPVGGNGTKANIYSLTGSDNGVFINGEKTNAFLRKIAENRYYVCLSEAGYSVGNGDIVTINGCFEYKGTPILFAPLTVKYTSAAQSEEGIWSVVKSGTVTLKKTSLDSSSDGNSNYIVEGDNVKVLYPNEKTAVAVADKTVLYEEGDYIMSRIFGQVTFQKAVSIYKSGAVDVDSSLNMIGATGAGQYAEDYISGIDVTENGTAVFSITDGNDTTYQTQTNYDEYGLDYVLDFNFDREIKVLQLTDTQIIDSTQLRYADRLYASSVEKYKPENMESLLFTCMRDTVKAAQPDLILLTGDIIYGEFDDKGTSLQALIRELDSYQIPWAPVFGNHDNESAMGVEWQCEELMKSEYCLFKRRHDIGGNGNYTIGLSKEGELQRVIFMMDSNFCFGAPEREYTNGNLITKCGFTDNQITWYRASQLRVNQVAGTIIPSFLCFHVPDRGVLEGALWAGYQTGEDSGAVTYTIGTDVVAQSGDSGYKGGAFGDCVDTAMLPFMNEVGTDGAFFGHQHLINTSIYYSGVRFTFGLKTGAYDKSPSELGGTLISLKHNTQTGESFVISQIVVN